MNEFETERRRLARTYAGLSDEALLELAADAASLTTIAEAVLVAELSRRSLEIPKALTEASTNLLPRMRFLGPPVMVERFRDMPEAFVAQSLLDSAGIDCFLADENTIRMDWFWSNLLGGFKLIVRSDDVDDARLIFQAAELAGAAAVNEIDRTSGDTPHEYH